MDVAISRYLGLLPDLKVPKDEFTNGYFGVFVPFIALAICAWLAVRIFARMRPIGWFLRTASGIMAVFATPVLWLLVAYGYSRTYGYNLLTMIPFYEVVVILVLAILCLFGRWRVPLWTVAAILVSHYLFWFWQLGRNFVYGGGMFGNLGLIVGLCGCLTWLFYVRELRQSRGVAA
jgi:hypothetical protein